jgi:hypothetical protein
MSADVATSGFDSNSPTKSRGERNGLLPEPVRWDDLKNLPDPEWLVEGLPMKGHYTLLMFQPKAGKTTFLCHLLAAMEQGGSFGGAVKPGKVLVVTEKSPTLWKRRGQTVGYHQNVRFLCRPFMSRPTRQQWEQTVGMLLAAQAADPCDLIVLDTFAGVFCGDNENGSVDMQTFLTPLHQLTQAGAAVLIVHHARKPQEGDGDGVQVSRGSNALPGFVDIVASLAKDGSTRRRILTITSRFSDKLEWVYELSGDNRQYQFLGDRDAANQQSRLTTIGLILQGHTEGLTEPQVLDAWPQGVKPGNTMLRKDLQAGVAAGRWERSGKGVKGSPYTYSIPAATPPYRGSTESEPSAGRRALPDPCCN